MSLVVIKPQWPAPSNIIAFCTTKQGGESQGQYQGFNLGAHVGDNLDSVNKHRSLLVEQFKLPTIVWLNQIHTSNICDLDKSALNDEELNADASICASGQYTCAVMTADCLPVLITDIQARKIAAVHCGWRSLAMGILEKTINTLELLPKELLIWLGPCIGAQKFEVGEDVLKAFAHYPGFDKTFVQTPRQAKWLFDITKMATLILNQNGVNAIYGGEHCTFSDSINFYSYRRDGITGRMASVIARV